MQDILNNGNQFSTLSITDLLKARDQYHFHLMNKENVIATAIGYYLIRKNEPWPTDKDHNPDTKKFKSEERTLKNSEVRPYSWPAILVFVDTWKTESELANGDPRNIVPKALDLEDGRSVPVCVVWAPREHYTDVEVDESKLNFPRNIIGGGFPLITYVQGERRIATFGCLVTDGHLTYALTNKHVAGEGGTPIYTKLAGAEVEIGRSSKKHIGRISFNKIYEGWPGKNVYTNMDIGLIEINDICQWKTEVYKVGTMGRLADLSTGNFSLGLIGKDVVGYGSVSKKIEGKIQALFYRYKSVGGYEYLSDFLIGANDGKPFNIHSGDSGAVMMYKRFDQKTKKTEYMPIGVLWGQHVIIDEKNNSATPYALVNCLSLGLNQLDVDLVRGWNLDVDYTWGKVGHYTIGLRAIEAVNATKYPNLRKLLDSNKAVISFEKTSITDKLEKYKGYKTFCPLADVPDIIFKMGGTGIQRGGEKPNHYADIDLPRNSDGKSLRKLVEQDAKKNLTPDVWSSYYDEVGIATMHKGILPFRVWQIFNEMVEYIKQGDVLKFIGAAGILTHYVGDACQPLHSSYMSQGEVLNDKGNLVMYAKNVHTIYEDKMVDEHYKDISDGLDTEIKKKEETIRDIKTGFDAGMAVFDLMCQTQDTIKPKDILDTYVKKNNSGELWKKFGKDTITVMARGCRYQAKIWEAAWRIGNGENTIKKLSTVDTGAMKKLYEHHKDDFIPSVTIKDIKNYL